MTIPDLDRLQLARDHAHAGRDAALRAENWIASAGGAASYSALIGTTK